MASFKKLLCRTGIHKAPQGELVATPQRVRAWAEKFKKMKALGIKVPVAWGHQPKALPADQDDREHQLYYRSKFNAGYLDELDFDEKDGNLYGVVDAPGCELADGNLVHQVELSDGTKAKGAIGEVSIAIRDWKDGQGRDWPDSIIHVALTPLPVVADQGGFSAGPAPSDQVYSLSTLLYGLAPAASYTLASKEGPMKDDKKKPDDKDKDKPTEGTYDTAKGDAKNGDDLPKPPDTKGNGAAVDDDSKDGDDKSTAGSKNDKAAHFSRAKDALMKQGYKLPDHADAENGWDHLANILEALNHQQGESEPGQEEPQDGKQKRPVGPAQKPTEEPRPIMMSLATAQTPGEKGMILTLQKKHQESLSERIDKLAARGVPADEVQSFRERISTYELSLDDEWEPTEQKLDYELSVWERTLDAWDKAKPAAKDLTKQHLTRATPVVRPDINPDNEYNQDEINSRAAAVSTSRRK